MNTVFKLGYQAWLLLGARRGAARCRGPGRWLPARALWPALGAGRRGPARCSALVYPYAGTYARKGGFSTSPYARRAALAAGRAPGDPGAIDWLRDQRAGDAGRARGGRRRLLGLRPRADLDLHRPADRDGLGRPRAPVGARPGGRARRTSRRIYTTHRPRRGAPLLDRYGVRYVVVGPLERTTYGDAGVAKWDQLGRGCTTATAPRSGSCTRRLLDVEPLGHPAGRVPRPALRDPASAPDCPGRQLPVVAHPPDAERELPAV